MESESHDSFQESVTTLESSPNNGAVRQFDQPGAHCAVCWKLFLPDNEVNGSDLPDICRDCKVAYLANIDTTTPESHHTRTFRGRRVRNSSSESIEDIFSQQFSHLINLVRRNQLTSPITASDQEARLVDGDASMRLPQPMSSHTTPSGSRRWWRSVSDNESESFDNLDSVFGESESIVSYGGYGAFHGDGDTISHSAYGAESEISVDVNSFLDRDLFIQPDDGSDIDSDTDIDPMHAGLDQWDSDDHDEEDGDWGESIVEENTDRNVEAGRWIEDVLSRSRNEANVHSNWLRGFTSSDRDSILWRARESRRSYNPNMEQLRVPSYVGNSGDYLDAVGFEQLLEQLAEADSSRRGAPPTAASFVDTLPCVVIDEEHTKHGDLVCAVCKELLSVGTAANQLPCMHVYHPSCILPWLNARNSCPLCRYELPTDDKDYEERKRVSGIQTNIPEILQSDSSENSSDDLSDGEINEECEMTDEGAEHRELVTVNCATDSSTRERTRGGWLLLVATPIVSLVGMVLVIWSRNPLAARVRPRGQCDLYGQHQQQVQIPLRNPRNGQGTNRKRRWWSFF